MKLNDEQRILVEQNTGLVGQVIKDKVRNISGIGVFTYQDLFQIGCVGLCKAAVEYTGAGRFSTYAYIIIRNEIFSALAKATTYKKHETGLNPDALCADITLDDKNSDIQRTLEMALVHASGITAKGIMAIRLLIQGYSYREIGERMGGVSVNNVTALVSRARKYLKTWQTGLDNYLHLVRFTRLLFCCFSADTR